jgi:hypothetical protein
MSSLSLPDMEVIMSMMSGMVFGSLGKFVLFNM